MERADVTFDSSGDRCAAWLYLPDGVDVPRPCVVPAHGWSGIREARLDAYAERFAAAGLAALVFDYRHFGASEGEPRQLLDIRRQLEDWAAAVAYARSLGGVDADRVALWGTSFSGGHVIETAARDGRVAAVVAQMPYVDGLRNLPRLGIRHSLRLTVEGVKDEIDRLRGRPPRMLKSVGPPGSLAIMTSPDAEPGFRRLIPPDVRWIDETAGRIVLRVATHRPIRRARAIRCPILFCVVDDDVITPTDLALEAADAAPRSEVRRYAGGHFDPYVGELFERVVADQVDFLSRHLLGEPAAAGDGEVSYSRPR